MNTLQLRGARLQAEAQRTHEPMFYADPHNPQCLVRIRAINSGSEVQPEPEHTYKGTQIHHEKWWQSGQSEAFDDLFLVKGRDARKHPDWGKRRVMS